METESATTIEGVAATDLGLAAYRGSGRAWKGRQIDAAKGFEALWEDLALAWVDLESGIIADCSPAFAQLLESLPAEVIGGHSGKLFEDEDGIAWREALEQLRDREVTRISRVPVKLLPKHAKRYSAALIWAAAIYQAVDAPATYVLVHLWPSEKCKESVEEHEMQLMMRVQRIERELGALAARPEIHVDHATRVGGNVGGDFTGGNKNNPEVFRWLVIGFLGLVTASIWWWYYQHGGTYVPPDAIPRVAP